MSTESKPIEQYKTKWTSNGPYRLDVQQWPDFVILTCETEGITLPKGEKYLFSLGRIVILTGGLVPDAERFAEHAFSFYSDELAGQAARALRGIFNDLKQPDPDEKASAPPRGGVN